MSITGLILAGGRGERVGGVDKGCLEYRGRPLIELVAERFAPQVHSLLISANRNVERYADIAEVISDDEAQLNIEPFAGPLIGVLSGLRRTQTDWLAFVPCDAPCLPLDLVQRLQQALGQHAAACARVGGVLQPTFALIRTNTADDLARRIESGERALHRWLESLRTVAVDFDDSQAFANINTLADIKR